MITDPLYTDEQEVWFQKEKRMKFVIGFILGAAGMFGVWWYTRYVELKNQ